MSIKKKSEGVFEVRWWEAEIKACEKMVARDGIEPPTPAFSGPRSTN